MLVADFEVRRREFPVVVRLELGPGQRLALVGASGAGKTTILLALAGLLRLQRGTVTLGPERVDGRPGRSGVGLVTQAPMLFPHLTVERNLLYPLGVGREAALALAGRLGLGGLLGSRPAALSQGERHRAALARTILAGCRLLCLDEPFAALDRPLADELLGLVVEEVERLPYGGLMVTHRLEEAQAFSERLGVVHRGRLLQVGNGAELLHRPATPEVARLLGYRGWLSGPRGVLALHPELLSGPAGEPVTARVLSCRPLGARFDLELAAEGEWRGRLHQYRAEPLAPGAAVTVRASDPIIFSRMASGDD